MKPVVLTILDGWGYSKQKHGNAILNAKTPNIDSIQQNYPSLLLQASGKAAGLTWGESGNSEVGHLTLGAGRVIFQHLSRITKAISNGEFFENEMLGNAIGHVKSNDSTLHLAGLLTSGSVHAYLGHLFALIDLAVKNEIKSLEIHIFTDGKDSGLKEAPALIKKLQDYIDKTGQGSIATIIGRDYAMDRDKNWNNTKKTYDLLVNGEGEKTSDVVKKIEEIYNFGITDSKLPPLIIDEQDLIEENDAVIFFNFREDSMRQLARSFVEKDFKIFPVKRFENLFVVVMTQYLVDSLNVAFPISTIKNGLAEILNQNNKKQFHIAETEKYAHVTYFFNCLNNEPYPGETDVFIESNREFLENPEMRTPEITEKVIKSINENSYDFYLINFANTDVLSHSGSFEITIKGVEAVDKAIGKLMQTVLGKDGTMIITSDHGNSEAMLYKSSGESETKHDDNPVPFYLIGKEFERRRSDADIESIMKQPSGLLADVAPTILELMNIEKPTEMTGESLLKIIR
ncbi:MAG: 2,3-bisphosphoglycerate-independent phosphoglycerate mutase [bacterium]|nr:2,3-bisphosphoglycerate-independent phosphoglycerate mutase [bacterium]